MGVSQCKNYVLLECHLNIQFVELMDSLMP